MHIGILSARDKIVRVELLHYVGPEKFDGTHVTDVVLVCRLWCHVEILPKFTKYERIEFWQYCLPLRSQWTRFMLADMCVYVSHTISLFGGLHRSSGPDN